MIRKISFSILLPLVAVLLMGAAFQFGGIRHDITSQTTDNSLVIMNSASTQVQRFTGSSGNFINLPSATSLRNGFWYLFINDSSSAVSVRNNSGTELGTVSAASSGAAGGALAYLAESTTSAGTWSFAPFSSSGGGGGGGGGTYWTGYHEEDCLWTNTTTAGYGDPGVDSSCTFTESFDSGSFPTVSSASSGGASNTLPGISFTANETATYEICAQTQIKKITSDGNVVFRLTDGTSTLSGMGMSLTAGPSQSPIMPMMICAFYSVTNSSSYTFKIQARGSSSAFQVGEITGSGDADRGIVWTIKSI